MTRHSLRKDSPRKESPRKGVLSVGVTLCFLVCVALLASMANQLLLARQASQLKQPQVQANGLADAGVRLALKRLDEDREYTGEVWHVSDLPASGRVTIVVRDDVVVATAVCTLRNDRQVTARHEYTLKKESSDEK